MVVYKGVLERDGGGTDVSVVAIVLCVGFGLLCWFVLRWLILRFTRKVLNGVCTG